MTDDQATTDDILTSLEEIRLLLEELVGYERDRVRRETDVLRK
jgi:hypothetical protein